MPIHYLVYFFIAFLFSAGLAYVAVKFFGRFGFLDFPNHRSMHRKPTPTSGGLAIGISFWITCCLWPMNYDGLWPWLAASSAFLLVGAADDFRSKKIFPRILFQLSIASCLAVWAFYNMESLDGDFLLMVLAVAFLVLSLVGAVNLFNFMDGADGLAATQSLIYFFTHACIFAAFGQFHLCVLALSISGVVGGFLLFNWSPAKLFMGDSGSYFLGSLHVIVGFFCFDSGIGFLPSLILVSPFLCDSVLTLINRFFSGESWWEGHRSHCYQLLLTSGVSARKLSFALTLLHSVCTLPLCGLSLIYPDLALLFALVVYSIIGFIWYYLRKSFVGTV